MSRRDPSAANESLFAEVEALVQEVPRPLRGIA